MEPAQLPLRDIHLPPGIGWWPPAIGWWLLAILAPLIIVLIYWIYKRVTKKTALKSAKTRLLQIKQDMQLDNAQKLAQLSMLIRRVAISTANRNECAGLTGRQWLEYLDRSMKGKPFTEGAGNLLGNDVYRKAQPSEQEISQLISLCENWLNAQGKKRK
jgi:hypothetical protein